jgi:aryl-alcohol dehydrogenase-like predicted oxidoreductase
MRSIGTTDLSVFPISLGTNVFGWTADKETSFTILDAYVDGGGNFLDTADVYPYWATGESTSETIIGEWLASRRNRDSIVLATKVGMLEGLEGLAPATIRTAVEDSLRRLRTDYIDLYWAHVDDHDTPLVESLAAFDALIQEGKVRHVGASNYSAGRLAEALKISDAEGLARYVALQQPYNLVERGYEGELREVVAGEGLSSVPYFGLARGFLTGKYAPGVAVDSPRAGKAAEYLETAHGPRTVEALQVPRAGLGGAGLGGRPADGHGADRQRAEPGAVAAADGGGGADAERRGARHPRRDLPLLTLCGHGRTPCRRGRRAVARGLRRARGSGSRQALPRAPLGDAARLALDGLRPVRVGGDRVLDGGVGGEDGGQAGDLEDAGDAVRGHHERERAVLRAQPLETADEHAQPGRVEELHLAQVGDDVHGALGREVDDLLAQLGGGEHVDLAGDLEHGAAADRSDHLNDDVLHLAPHHRSCHRLH